MARKSYPTDLNDMEWEILAPLIPIQAHVDVIRRTEQEFQVLPKRACCRKNIWVV